MIWRALVIVLSVAATRALAAGIQPDSTAVERVPLSGLSWQIGEWRGIPDPPLAPEILEVLRVDDYVSRRYVAPDKRLVGLYVGFYDSQRQGGTIHSPQHCLPGTGWMPVRIGRLAIEAGPDGRLVVNRFVVQKQAERQLVLYWYQGRGRTVASDYLHKFYLVFDALRYQRTDGALVRVTAPIWSSEAQAERAAADFVRDVQPRLGTFVPGS